MSLKLAIVGRPNVGKSTLFNRLAGKRLAIVDDLPGVTRDRREGEGKLADLDLQIIDTAGFEDVTDESLEARMRAQTEAAIGDADVILLLIDARVGVTPADERFADLLRRADKPVLLAANKCEGKAGDVGLSEAYALGLGEPIALSAEHGEGMSELYAALAPYEISEGETETAEEDVEAEEDGEAKPIRLAIIGRPNAGKSTLVNALIGADRMLTGPEAGITRDAITIEWEWEGRPIKLVDTAGMRRKAKVQGKLEHLSVGDTLRSIRYADICVLVMDASEAFEKQDLAIGDLVLREGRGLVLAISKWDQVSDKSARLKELKETLEESLPQARGAPLVTLSAIAGVGLDRLMSAAFSVYKDWNARVKTPDLNRWLQHMVERHPPPAVNGKRIKPRYMAQIKSRPPTFVLIASRAADMPESYKRYLMNGLRDAFELRATPIRLNVKGGKNPYAEGS
ncbi:MAG: ribosome biogenesis GTPase Der [Hyphomonadaceae bacterium]